MASVGSRRSPGFQCFMPFSPPGRRLPPRRDSDTSAFHPASDTPASRHCATSQRIIGARSNAASRSCAEAPVIAAVEVQAVTPRHQPHSTPA